MKTLNEAISFLHKQPDFWEKNRSLSEEITSDPKILMSLFLIGCDEDPLSNKLLKVVCMGIAVGIEMEKGE